MSDLVKKLKSEHEALIKTLDTITVSGISSRDGQAKLYAARDALLAHLELENKDLYPVLRKAAETNENLKRTLDVFAKDMENISTTALDFFNHYTSGGESLEFARDAGKLIAALKNRIGKEEDILYKQYDKLL